MGDYYHTQWNGGVSDGVVLGLVLPVVFDACSLEEVCLFLSASLGFFFCCELSFMLGLFLFCLTLEPSSALSGIVCVPDVCKDVHSLSILNASICEKLALSSKVRSSKVGMIALCRS